MAALVETHSESEVLAAIAAGAQIIGINNRDLDTMTVSLDDHATSRAAGSRRHLVVAESGIETPRGHRRAFRVRRDAFLIGGSLLRAEIRRAALRALVTSGRRPRAAESPLRS